MKRGRQILLIAVVLGVCMFFCSRYLVHQPSRPGTPQHERESLLPELAWLHEWLGLDEAQLQKVKGLHLDYRPQCQALCVRAQEAEMELLAALKDPSADLSPLLRKRAEVEIESQQAMLAHVRKTAACLTPVQARKYYETMLPHILSLRLPRDSESPSSH